MAEKPSFKCSKCDRSFSMAAHLARHMSTIHGPKKAKVTAKKKRKTAAKKRRPVAAKKKRRVVAKRKRRLVTRKKRRVATKSKRRVVAKKKRPVAAKKSRPVARKKRPVAARKRRPAAARPTGRPAAASFGGLLGQMRVHRNGLVAQRDRLDMQIRGIDGALAALGAGGARRPGRRPARGREAQAGSLKDYIGRVLRGRTRGASVKDVTAAVRKAGYKTKNKTLDKSVGIALAQMPNVAKVARGIFRLK